MTLVTEASIRLGCSLVISTAALEVAVALTYLAGGPLTGFHFLVFVAVLAALLVAGPRRAKPPPDSRIRPLAFAAGLLVVVACFTIAGSTFDLSPDGQTTHMAGIAHLAHGWNPIHDPEFIERPGNYILSSTDSVGRYLVTKAAKGSYMAAASAYTFLGRIECGKAFNLVLLSAAALLALAAAKGAGLGNATAVTVAAVAALNPVPVVQSLTTYLDGQNGTLFTCLVALTLLLVRRQTTLLVVGWGATIALMMGVKGAALVFVAFMGPGLLAYLRWQTGRFHAIWTFGVASALGAGVIGFSPYVVNLVRYGDLIHPYRSDWGAAITLRTAAEIAGLVFAGFVTVAVLLHAYRRPGQSRSVRTLVIAVALAAGMTGFGLYLTGAVRHGDALYPLRLAGDTTWAMGSQVLDEPTTRASKFLASILSVTAANPERNELKMPFRIQSTELLSYRLINPDHRAGGFGPWMGGAFLTACVVALLAFIKPGEGRAELGFLLALILASILLHPEPWYARYVPQTWLLPLIVAAYGCRSGVPTSVRRGAHVLLVILAVNVSLVLYQNVRGQLAIQSAVHRTMLALRSLPRPLPVYLSNFVTVGLRFRDYGLEYVDTPLANCQSYLGILRSEVRVCVQSPDDAAWREVLGQAQRIDEDLERAGVGSFQVVKIHRLPTVP